MSMVTSSFVDGPVWLFLGSLSLQITLVVICAAGLALLLRSGAPRLRHLVWLIVLLRLAFPFVVSSPWGLLPAMDDGAVTVQQQVGGVLGVGKKAGPTNLWGDTRPWLAAAVGLVWLAGALALGGLTVFHTRRLRGAIARGSTPASGALVLKVRLLCERMHMRRAPHVRVLHEGAVIPSPALFGLIRPVLLLPPTTSNLWAEEVLEPVLVHELVHLRRRDHWVNALQWFVQAIYFFHPLAWWANRRLRVERELACDDEVARRCGTKAYLAALLVLAESRATSPSTIPAAVAMAESAHLLPLRIRRMSTMKNPKRSSTFISRAVFAAVLAVALLPLLLAASQPSAIPAGPGVVFLPTNSSQDAENTPLIPGLDGVTEPKLLHKVQPVYPEEARKARVNGKVILQAVIDAAGDVSKIEVFSKPQEDLGFEEAAIAAVRQWRYEPATQAGKPVEVFITVVIKFRLDNDKKKGEEDPSV